MNPRIKLAGLMLSWAILPGCSEPPAETPSAPGEAKEVGKIELGVSFEREIKPLLSNKCTICHNTKVLVQRAYFETREGAMKSGMIVAGEPEKSRMLAVVKEGRFEDKAMPPVSHRLTTKEIKLLRAWIEEGAEWPKGEAGRVKPAFLPKE